MDKENLLPLTTRPLPLTSLVCIFAPLLCFGLDQLSQHLWNYHFGYELLMLNGLLTFCGLWAVDHLRSYNK